MTNSGQDIDHAKHLLENGSLVALPTETVYGLAGNAFNIEAITQVFKVKRRPSFDPLIVHTHSLEAAEHLVEAIPENARILAERFWPGPITLLLKKKNNIADLVTSGMDTVAVRVPNQPLTLELLAALDFPLVAPSANPFGYVSPTTAKHVKDQLNGKIAYIMDGGPCQIGIESTIIGFEEEVATVYRLGGCSVEKIESCIGRVQIAAHSTSDPKAPGMLKSHYAPVKPLKLGIIVAELKKREDKQRIGIISFNTFFDDIPADHQLQLAPDGKLETAAKNLFSILRRMDSFDVDIILTESVPDHGLGRAINDRLRRAAAK
ncbi:threonylcarbamoyl-AMP synthase [Fulvivirga sp. M361]|uniref:L-threonylcarbamoyladenylate synthase n=1 Tax=Fulvivirga sp. M361 TaxID=2594266 RepID=UPI00117ABFB7|nr:L-threonylcarbamoyladenylate synthase [Fulvivirga sp. M361]TRX56081.1 threonylcarbamoyl-AMP synthase [Fulvivirga sp. M361]